MKRILSFNPITLLAFTGLLAAVTVIQAGDVPHVPYPQDFRSWQHVRTIEIGPENVFFARRGGFHHYYANAQAVEGYRSGVFPDGSVLVDEGVFTKPGEGPLKGWTLEGERRTVDVMVKSARLYGATGGWGFEHFERDNRTGTLDANGRAQCEGCHAKAPRDHVYTAVRP
jgi:hypothetical protein